MFGENSMLYFIVTHKSATKKNEYIQSDYLKGSVLFYANQLNTILNLGNGSFVKVEVLLRPAHDGLVGLVEVLLGDHVSILSHRLHAGLLADAGDICSADLVRTAHVLLKVNVFRKVHLRGNGLENESLLAAVGQGELDFSVETARTQQGGIESVCSVGRHDDLHIDVLFETVHLVEQLDEHSLHFSVCSGLSVKTPR